MLERVVAAAALVLVVIFSFAIDGFATLGNLRVVLTNSASLAILSCGMAVVIISRGLDLSLIAQMVAGATIFGILISNGVAAPAAPPPAPAPPAPIRGPPPPPTPSL